MAIREKFESVLRHFTSNSNAPTFELIGYLYQFLSALAESSINRKQAARGGMQDFYIRRILAYIDENYHKGINVGDISTYCSLDKSHLGKLFKSNVGTNLRDFLVQYRISKACDFIQNTHHTISEISAMVGYSNMFNFSRTFKAVLGESPRQWREKNKLR